LGYAVALVLQHLLKRVNQPCLLLLVSAVIR
jgi:hypothetical protein